MDELVKQALALLPLTGEVVFDVYKNSLNSKMPDNAKDVFTRILKMDMLNRRVAYDANHNIQVYLSRKVS